jgi:hypothetical protein
VQWPQDPPRRSRQCDRRIVSPAGQRAPHTVYTQPPNPVKSGRSPNWTNASSSTASAGGPGPGALAGRARPLRPVADRQWAVPALATRRHLAILTGLQPQAEAEGLITWQVNVDTYHRPCPPARRWRAQRGDRQCEEPGGVDTEPADHALGRSRGELTSKLHLAVEQGQRPLSIVIPAGQRGDAPQFETVVAGIWVPRLGPGRPRTRPDRVRADKAYSSRAIRAHLRHRGISCTVPQTQRPGPQPQAARPPGRSGTAGQSVTVSR